MVLMALTSYTQASVAEALQQVRSRLPSGVRLVAVSTSVPVERIREAYEQGQAWAFGLRCNMDVWRQFMKGR